MPNNDLRQDYAEWLATPPTTGLLVETLEITGAALGAPILLCNRRSTPLVAADENGLPRTFLPLSFTFTKPAIRNSSEYVSTVRIDGVEGRVLQLFSRVSSLDLTKPVLVSMRAYIDPTMLDRPVWLPPLRFRCEQARVSMDVIELDLVGGRMPTKRAGIYYTMERFEGLRPF